MHRQWHRRKSATHVGTVLSRALSDAARSEVLRSMPQPQAHGIMTSSVKYFGHLRLHLQSRPIEGSVACLVVQQLPYGSVYSAHFE
jgi:hypothetical protein